MSAGGGGPRGSERELADTDAVGSRRELLLISGLAGAAVLAGCSKHSSRPKVHRIPSTSRSPDVTLLNHALDLEHRAIAAYTAGIPLLDRRSQQAAKIFLTQELDHAGELAGLIQQAGGRGVKPPASYDFGRPRDARDVLNLLRSIERAQIAGYLAMIPSLSPGAVRAAVSTVLCNDAQHDAVLRSRLGLTPAPSPLVTGLQ